MIFLTFPKIFINLIKAISSFIKKQIRNKKHIRNLKQALNHRLVLEKVHRMIKFNQNA